MKPSKPPYDVFVSYRRDGATEIARLLFDSLRQRGFRVFFDLEGLSSGKYGERLHEAIEQSTDFVVLLSPDGIARCAGEGDWLRQEIAHAIRWEKNIVPVMLKGCEMPQPADLPEDICDLANYNGVPHSDHYFDGFMNKLAGYLKSKPDRSHEWRERIGLAAKVVKDMTPVAMGFLKRAAEASESEPPQITDQADERAGVSLFPSTADQASLAIRQDTPIADESARDCDV